MKLNNECDTISINITKYNTLYSNIDIDINNNEMKCYIWNFNLLQFETINYFVLIHQMKNILIRGSKFSPLLLCYNVPE